MADFLPLQGPADSLPDRLRMYVEPFEPELVAQWRGADDMLVGEYARLSGFGDSGLLPPSYSSYARALGIDNGGLFKDFRYETRLQRVIKLYHDCMRSEPETLNPKLPICGMTEPGDQLSFDRRPLEERTTSGAEPAGAEAGEPAVAPTVDGEWCAMVSRSWETLVFQAAILRVEPRRLQYGRWLSSSAKSLNEALRGADSQQGVAQIMEDFAGQRGLGTAWVSDSAHHIFLSAEATLYVKAFPESGLLMYAFAAREDLLLDIKNVLGPRLRGTVGITTIRDGRLGSTD